jgi:hypothetical protein
VVCDGLEVAADLLVRSHQLARGAAVGDVAAQGVPPRANAEMTVSTEHVVAAARRAHESGKAVLVMTGGDRRLEQLVLTWLGRNGVPAPLVLMRGRGDYRPGPVVKRERLRAAHRQFANLSVWSAAPNVPRLSEQEGIRVTVLPGYWGDVQ